MNFLARLWRRVTTVLFRCQFDVAGASRSEELSGGGSNLGP